MAIKEILLRYFLNVSVVPSIFSEIRQDTARVEQHKKATIISLDKDQSDTKEHRILLGLGWVPEKPGFHRKSYSLSRAITTQFSTEISGSPHKTNRRPRWSNNVALHSIATLHRDGTSFHKTSASNRDITAEGNFSSWSLAIVLPIGDDERCDKNVLTFIIVIPFRPICCHETAQSAAHVPTARPFIDLEQPGMIAKRLRRKVFGNCCIGREGCDKNREIIEASCAYLFWWLWSTRLALCLWPRRGKA